MKWIWGLLLLLLACTTQVPEAVVAPATVVSFGGCTATLEIGEQCSQDCECLLPGNCINDVCALTKLEHGKPCMENKQCLSGYCTQTGSCGGPDGPSATYECERECDSQHQDRCYTACRRR